MWEKRRLFLKESEGGSFHTMLKIYLLVQHDGRTVRDGNSLLDEDGIALYNLALSVHAFFIFIFQILHKNTIASDTG